MLSKNVETDEGQIIMTGFHRNTTYTLIYSSINDPHEHSNLSTANMNVLP